MNKTSRFILTLILFSSFSGIRAGNEVNEDRIRKNPTLMKLLLTSAGISNDEAIALTRQRVDELIQIVDTHDQSNAIHNAICITCNQPASEPIQKSTKENTVSKSPLGPVLAIKHAFQTNPVQNKKNIFFAPFKQNNSPAHKKNLIDDDKYDRAQQDISGDNDLQHALRESKAMSISNSSSSANETFLKAISNSDFDTILDLINKVSEDTAQQALEIALSEGKEVIADLILNRQPINQQIPVVTAAVVPELLPQNDQQSEAIFLEMLASQDTQPNMAIEIIENNKEDIFSERDNEHNNLFHILLHRAFENPDFIEIIGRAIQLDQNHVAINATNKHNQTPLSLAQNYLKQYDYFGEIVGMMLTIIGQSSIQDDVRAPMQFESMQIIESDNQNFEEEYFFATQRNLATILQHPNKARAISYANDLIKEGTVDLYERDEQGNTALMIAARFGFSDIVRTLISHFADPCDINPLTGENTLLYVLAYPSSRNFLSAKQEEIIEMLLNREDVEQMLEAPSFVGNALTLAAQLNNKKLVENILDKKPDLLNLQNTVGQTALHIALNNNFANIAELLLERGATLATEDVHGNTPIGGAVRAGNLKIVKYLIDNGFIDERMFNEMLSQAVNLKNDKLLELLILSRDPEISQKTRETLLKSSQLSSTDERIRELLSLSDNLYDNPQFMITLAKTAYPSDTQAIEYVRANNSQAIKEVMGLDINAQNSWGLTPLIAATLLGRDTCALHLLSKGADPNSLFGGKSVSEILNVLLENALLGKNGYVFYDLLERIKVLQDKNKIQEEKNKRNRMLEAALQRFQNNA